MKIKVTWEKIFDSKEFYHGASEEDLTYLSEEAFKDGIYQQFEDDPYDIMDVLKFEVVNE